MGLPEDSSEVRGADPCGKLQLELLRLVRNQPEFVFLGSFFSGYLGSPFSCLHVTLGGREFLLLHLCQTAPKKAIAIPVFFRLR